MSHLNAVVIDLETTGLNPKTDKIIEIGAARIRDGRIKETFQSMVAPGRKLEQITTDITGITDASLIGAPLFEQIVDSLLDFIGEDDLLGHNINGDYAFLKKAIVTAKPKGFSFMRRGMDTLKLARRFLPSQQKKTLSQACAYFGIYYEAHRALNDALATYELYEKLYEEFQTGVPEAFVPFQLNYQVKREQPIMPKQIEQIYRLLEEYHLESLYEVEKMTKSEASRYIDRIKNGSMHQVCEE